MPLETLHYWEDEEPTFCSQRMNLQITLQVCMQRSTISSSLSPIQFVVTIALDEKVLNSRHQFQHRDMAKVPTFQSEWHRQDKHCSSLTLFSETSARRKAVLRVIRRSGASWSSPCEGLIKKTKYEHTSVWKMNLFRGKRIYPKWQETCEIRKNKTKKKQ